MSILPIFPRFGAMRHSVPMFSRAIDEMIGEMQRLERGFNPYWKNADDTLFTGNNVSEVINDKTKFAVSLDVSQFKPEELKVKIEGQTVTIEGNQELHGADGFAQRSFIRKWTLPEDVDVSSVQSSLTEKGHLSIEAPKKGQPSARSIPIMPAASPACPEKKPELDEKKE